MRQARGGIELLDAEAEGAACAACAQVGTSESAGRLSDASGGGRITLGLEQRRLQAAIPWPHESPSHSQRTASTCPAALLGELRVT